MKTLACAGCEDWFEPDDDHVRIEASVEQGTRFLDVRLSCLKVIVTAQECYSSLTGSAVAFGRSHSGGSLSSLYC